MHPILFEIAGVTVYSYGFMIAMGTLAGVAYMAIRGKKEVGLTFDQANSLFLLIFVAAFVGGKAFLFLEDASYYAANPRKLLAGRGFVFYGSFLFAVPTMLWYFRKIKVPAYQMLDVMAITTCLVHSFGRVGCFLAGCCHGKPTESGWGVVFTDTACHAEPLNTPLYPTQLMEAGFIVGVMLVLLFLRNRKQFHGQLFLLYLIFYAAGRFLLEYFRGDIERGFLIEDYLSHSQFISLMIMAFSGFIYLKRLQASKTSPIRSK
jgi:phosphatidylglycerol---prolipoprotein diacylglyceryl transferase